MSAQRIRRYGRFFARSMVGAAATAGLVLGVVTPGQAAPVSPVVDPRDGVVDVPGEHAGPVAEAEPAPSSFSADSPLVGFPKAQTVVLDLVAAAGTEVGEEQKDSDSKSTPSPTPSLTPTPETPSPSPTPEETGDPTPDPDAPPVDGEGEESATPDPTPSPEPSPSDPPAEDESVEETPAPVESDEAQKTPVPVEVSWSAAGDSGVLVSLAAPDAAESLTADPGTQSATVSFSVLSAEVRSKLGVNGLAFELSRVDAAGAATVTLRIPSSLVEGLYGADYASRVAWQVLSSTAKGKKGSAAEAAAITGAEVVSWVDESGDTLVSVPVSKSALTLFAAAMTSSASGTGDFSASKLGPASSWDVSAQTGAFTWSYPLPVPPAPGPVQPSLGLAYNSQLVDGRTSGANNQPSSIGEGWDLSGLGFIERTYVTCSKDDGSGGPVSSSGDLCWKSDNATLSFGPMSGPLVKDSTSGVWKLESDDNVRVERLIGTGAGCAANGTYNTECWRLTAPDGTQYYFGQNRLPGWSSGKAETNSAWTVPVFGNDTGEPCKAGTFAASWCMQGWRWNLDLVVDVNGNAMAFYYNAELNKYAVNGSSVQTYTRGGSVAKIEYGLRYTSGTNTIYSTNAATGKVEFAYDTYGRCNDANPAANCSTQPVSGLATTPANTSKYPDSPYDQNCTGSSCPGLSTPSFWTTTRLSKVTTKAFVVTSSSYVTVDEWALQHSYPDPGDGSDPVLWLTQITHTGHGGGSSISVPPILFTGVTLMNRVWEYDGYAVLDKWRISSIRLETGATVSVNYSAEECTETMAPSILASPQSNTYRCFPQWWTPDTVWPAPPQLDLFHKYVVVSTVADPVTGGGGAQPIYTFYDYSAGTPAWRYNDNPFTPDAYRTWSQYAGYDKVTISVGTSASPSTQQVSEYVFFRGLDGDRAAPSGGTKSVSVTGFPGVTDSEWLAGRTYQIKTRNGAGGAVLSTTTTVPWSSSVTSNDGYRQARFVRDASVTVVTPLSTGGTRTNTTETTYNAQGNPTAISQINPSGEISTCTTITYAADNTTAWLIGLPSQKLIVAKKCSVSPTLPADHLTGQQFYYDGSTTLGAMPSAGLGTMSKTATDYSGSPAAPVWTTTSTTVYDAIGRLTSTTDVLGRSTTTVYTPSATAAAGSGTLTQVAVTNTSPFSWVSTTVLSPTRGSVLSVTDANGLISSADYDALGRVVKVWSADHPKASFPSSPSLTYTYTQSVTAPMSIATAQLGPTSTITSYELFDGLGRTVQIQTASPGGGIAATDTAYDTAGQVAGTNNTYWASAVGPSGTLFVPIATSALPSRTEYVYDGAGRVTEEILISMGAERSRTSTVYDGSDRVDATPPSGGTPTTTITDSQGQVTRLTQYLSSIVDPLSAQVDTVYEYGPFGMTRMLDDDGNEWTWSYDLLGRQIGSQDPDRGASSSTFDLAGRRLTTSDARGVTIASVYDNLDRVIELREGSSSGPLLSKYVFDTIYKGQLTSQAAYVGSTAGTPGLAYTSTINSYDTGYRPTKMTVSIPSGAPAFGGTSWVEEFTYRQDGSPNVHKLPAGGGLPAESITTNYNIWGLPTSYGILGTAYAGAAGYSPIGNLVQFSHTGTANTYHTYGYDNATNQVVSIANQTLISGSWTSTGARSYTRNDAGMITSSKVTAAGMADRTECFAYDYLQNLTEAWTPTGGNCATAPSTPAIGGTAPYWTTWNVDPVTGNRLQTVQKATSASPTPTTSVYAYPSGGADQPHALAQTTTVVGTGTPVVKTYDHDDAGNMTDKAGTDLIYDALGRMVEVSNGSGTVQTNVYTPSGQLLLRIDATDGATLYLGMTELRDPVGSAPVEGTRTYSFGGYPAAERTAKTGVSGSTVYWLATDVVGTSTMRVHSTTGVITRRYLDPYGIALTATAWHVEHGYLNAPTAASTGLTRLGVRDYDPVLGRFLTVDPVLAPLLPQQNNGYSYAQNSPVTLADPTGNVPWDPACGGPCYPGKTPSAGGSSSAPTPSDPPGSADSLWDWDFIGKVAESVGAVVASIVVESARTTVNFVASLANAMVNDPAATFGLVLGLLMIQAGVSGEAAGVALDITGIGAIVGVPLNVASAALVAAGATLATASGTVLVYNALNDGRVEVWKNESAESQGSGASGSAKEPPQGPTNAKPDFKDPSKSPGPEWEWRGPGEPGSEYGAWFRPGTRETLHPDLDHAPGIGPHYDWRAPSGEFFRIFPDGTIVPK